METKQQVKKKPVSGAKKSTHKSPAAGVHRSGGVKRSSGSVTRSQATVGTRSMSTVGGKKKKKSSRRRKRMIRRMIILISVLVVLIIAAVFGGLYIYGKSALNTSITVEMGTPINAKSFAKDPERSVSFADLEEGQTYDTNIEPGEYIIRIKSGLYTYKCKLIIVDTTPPDLDVKDVTYFGERSLSPEDFVVSATDYSEVTLSFVAQPASDREGEQVVQIRATDESGNETVKDAKLTLIVDTEAPVIEGVRDELYAYVNETVSYKENVIISDDKDPDASFDVDASSVDMTKAGTYPVTYTARDTAGNSTTVATQIKVMERLYDEEQIRQFARDVLNQIVNDNMSDRDKLSAVYVWCRSNIGYANMTDDGDWMKAAYQGFTAHQGDCFVYCACAKYLLDELQIQNMIIGKIPNTLDHTKHFWNLVDIGEGWYHFDTTPRRAGGEFCYVDDATLMAYSEAHDLSHNYDHEQYPNVR